MRFDASNITARVFESISRILLLQGENVNRALWIAAWVIVLGFVAASSAQAQQWDLWAETAGTAGFDATNPDGSWSFLYGDTLVSGSQQLFDEPVPNCGHADRFCWFEAGGNPSIAINISDVIIHVSFGSNWPMEAGSVSVHPGDPVVAGPRHSMARWTSPVDGYVEVVFRVEDSDTDCGSSGDGVDWWLMHGDAVLTNGTLADGGTTGLAVWPVEAVTVADTLDLVVGPGPADNYICDTTLVEMTVRQLSVIFIDGFESGDTTWWSATSP